MPSYARKKIMNKDLVEVHHVVQKCVRGQFLCGYDIETGRDFSHRKKWIEDRIEFLSQVFCVEVASYSIMCNHIHSVVKSRPDLSWRLSDDSVIDRMWKLNPRKINGEYLDDPPKELREMWLNDPEWLDERRLRLGSISWFMYYLSNYIARRANREEDKKGKFWDHRFYSTHVVDECSNINANIYVDTNPYRAGMAKTVQDSKHTSVRLRKKMQTPKKNVGSHFLAQFKLASECKKNELPFLSISEKNYIEKCEKYMKKHLEEMKNPVIGRIRLPKVPSNLNEIVYDMRRHHTVYGTLESMREIAKQRGNKWLWGMGRYSKASEFLVSKKLT